MIVGHLLVLLIFLTGIVVREHRLGRFLLEGDISPVVVIIALFIGRYHII